MLWKDEVSMHIQTYLPHHIDAIILTYLSAPWRIIGFYGYPKECCKHESEPCCTISMRDLSLPWVCIGNYNEILASEEKRRRFRKAFAPMLAFRNTLLHCGLVDMGYQGNMFTWKNGRPSDAFVQEWIDRACANGACRDLFPRS